MTDYTVILLYPDYLADNYGQETYMTTVNAQDPVQAVCRARDEIISNFSKPEAVPYSDFFVIAVIKGKHEDLNPGI